MIVRITNNATVNTTGIPLAASAITYVPFDALSSIVVSAAGVITGYSVGTAAFTVSSTASATSVAEVKVFDKWIAVGGKEVLSS